MTPLPIPADPTLLAQQDFCGGFNSSATRVPFPLSGGPILIDSHHPSADVAILISFVTAPTTFTDFNTTSTGATYGLLKQFGTITGEGEVRASLRGWAEGW